MLPPSFAPAVASCHECISLGAHDAFRPSGVPRPPARLPPTPGGPPSDSPRGANDGKSRVSSSIINLVRFRSFSRAFWPGGGSEGVQPSQGQVERVAAAPLPRADRAPRSRADQALMPADRAMDREAIVCASAEKGKSRTATSSPSQGDSHQIVGAGSFDLGLLLHSSPSHQESRNRAFGNQRLRRHAPALGARIDCSEGE